MIIEPMMMNIGVIPPPPGYLADLDELLARARRATSPSTR